MRWGRAVDASSHYTRLMFKASDGMDNFMRYKTRIIVVAAILLQGCDDRYAEGYQDGHDEALAEVERRIAEIEEYEDEQSEASYGGGVNYRSVTTEVCGGGGVNVDGKHISPGKSGCVRVYSDGTTERY